MAIELNDMVRFCQGDEARTMLTGVISRAPWGREGATPMVTIRTCEARPRTFVRLVTAVEVIETEESVFRSL